MIAEAVERYLVWLETWAKPNTTRANRSTLRRFARWTGNVDLSTIDREMFARYREANSHLSPGAAEKTRLRILGFWDWCYQRGHGNRLLPVQGWPTTANASRIFVTEPEPPIRPKLWPALLDACPSPRNRAAMALHLHLGLSYGVLQRLRVGDYREGNLYVSGRPRWLKVAERAELDAWMDVYGNDPSIEDIPLSEWPGLYLFPSAPRGGYRGRYIPDKEYEGLTKALRSAKRSVLGRPTD